MTELAVEDRKEEAKKKGMCQSCFIRKALPGKTKCWVCEQREGKRRERTAARRVERKAEARASGMCQYCFTRPAEPGRTRCKGCLEKRSKRQSEWNSSHKAKTNEWRSKRRAERRATSKAEGLCTLCYVQPADPGYLTCSVCREKKLALDRARQNNNREIRRSRLNEERRLVIEHYGGKCACCGFDQYPALTIDHVNGGGVAHRKKIGGSLLLCRWLINHNYPEGFQILCWNCNCVKGMHGSCILDHQGEKHEQTDLC